jgi:hypothetical protein
MTKSDRHLAQFISRGSAIRSLDPDKLKEVTAKLALLRFFHVAITSACRTISPVFSMSVKR